MNERSERRFVTLSQRMRVRYAWMVVATSALLGLGVSMPSCPGQQALQKQVDEMSNTLKDTNKKILGMEGVLRGLEGDNKQFKELLEQMTKTIQAQKTALDQLDQITKELQAKATAKGSKSSASASAAKKKAAAPSAKHR